MLLTRSPCIYVCVHVCMYVWRRGQRGREGDDMCMQHVTSCPISISTVVYVCVCMYIPFKCKEFPRTHVYVCIYHTSARNTFMFSREYTCRIIHEYVHTCIPLYMYRNGWQALCTCVCTCISYMHTYIPVLTWLAVTCTTGNRVKGFCLDQKVSLYAFPWKDRRPAKSHP
jgi:hypothetical protein